MHWRYLCFVFFLVIPFSVQSQDEPRYSGNLQVGRFEGSADFHYKMVNKDTVLDGPFQMKGSNLDNLTANGLSYFSFEGQFDENLPEAEWTFEFGDFYASGGAELTDYHFRLKVSGTQHVATGEIDDGKPEGKWTNAVYSIDQSEKSETIFESEITFDGGIPKGAFRINDQDLTLLGRFQNEGFAHDVWALNFKNIPGTMENWHFIDGRLEKIVIERNENTDTLSVYEEEIENAKEIEFDKRYFRILKLQHILQNKSFVKFEGGMAGLIANNSDYFKRIDSLLSSLSGVEFMPFFKVKVEHYPLSDLEVSSLDSIRQSLQKIDELAGKIRENTQLNILKHADEEVRFSMAAANSLSGQFVRPVRKVLDYRENQVLAYLPREKLLFTLLAGAPSPELTVTYENDTTEVERSYTGPEADNFDSEASGLAAIKQVVDYALSSMREIEEELSEKLKAEKREQELVDLEEELMTRMGDFEKRIDSIGKTVSGDFREAIGKLNPAANKELSRYSALNDMQAKPEEARKLMDCLDEMIELAETIAKVPARTEAIEEEYTDDVWNPFTSTTMTEKVKKRIVRAYKEVLIPHLINRVEKDKGCQLAAETTAMLNATHRRMLKLKEENTSRIERKLKNEENPQTIMRLLQISIEKE